MNNASKGRCVTVTPRGTWSCDFRLAIFDGSATLKIQVAEQQLAEKKVESLAPQPERTWL